VKRAPKLTKRERKAAAPPRAAPVQCVSVNLNFDPPLRCTKSDGHHPPRHKAISPAGTSYQGVDVGGKAWYWAEYEGMEGYRRGAMLDPERREDSLDGTSARATEGEDEEEVS
jgi:hypothetical protein